MSGVSAPCAPVSTVVLEPILAPAPQTHLHAAAQKHGTRRRCCEWVKKPLSVGHCYTYNLDVCCYGAEPAPTSAAMFAAVKEKLKVNKIKSKVPWFDKPPEFSEDAAVRDDLLLEGIADPATMTRAELMANLAARGLKTTGLRKDLLSRMELYVQSKREASLHYMASDDARRREEITLEESGRCVVGVDFVMALLAPEGSVCGVANSHDVRCV